MGWRLVIIILHEIGTNALEKADNLTWSTTFSSFIFYFSFMVMISLVNFELCKIKNYVLFTFYF